MTWIKLDDGFADDPKVLGLTDKAFRAYVTGLCYAGRHLTDGDLAPAAVRTIASPKVRAELVEAGLWIDWDDGRIIINGYLKHQASRAEVEKKRAATAERTRRWRHRDAVTDASRDAVSDASIDTDTDTDTPTDTPTDPPTSTRPLRSHGHEPEQGHERTERVNDFFKAKTGNAGGAHSAAARTSGRSVAATVTAGPLAKTATTTGQWRRRRDATSRRGGDEQFVRPTASLPPSSACRSARRVLTTCGPGCST